jgi:hypothetical protein
LIKQLQAAAAHKQDARQDDEDAAATARGPQAKFPARSHAADGAYASLAAAEGTQKPAKSAEASSHAAHAAALSARWSRTAAVVFAAAKSAAAGAHPKSSVKV